MVISQLENCRMKGGRRRNAEETLRPKSRRIHLSDPLSTVSEQGQQLTSVLEEVQQSQSEQLKLIAQFMNSVTEMMKNTLKK